MAIRTSESLSRSGLRLVPALLRRRPHNSRRPRSRRTTWRGSSSPHCWRSTAASVVVTKKFLLVHLENPFCKQNFASRARPSCDRDFARNVAAYAVLVTSPARLLLEDKRYAQVAQEGQVPSICMRLITKGVCGRTCCKKKTVRPFDTTWE